jgi:hypothetical protein
MKWERMVQARITSSGLTLKVTFISIKETISSVPFLTKLISMEIDKQEEAKRTEYKKTNGTNESKNERIIHSK